MTIMSSIDKMEYNTEKYRALTKKEFYISIYTDEIDIDFLTKRNIKEQKIAGLKIIKIISEEKLRCIQHPNQSNNIDNNCI
jgi:hypothetical protein